MTGRTVDRPVRNPDRYRTGPDRTGPERPVAGTGSIYGLNSLESLKIFLETVRYFFVGIVRRFSNRKSN